MKERELLQDIGVEGRIMLRWSLMKYSFTVWAGVICLRVGSIFRLLCVCVCVCGIEPLDSTILQLIKA
jgi:hypothetical protein